MKRDPCPRDTELKAFVIGDLPTASLDRIAGHVDTCAQCRDVLHHFDAHHDELVAALSQTAHADAMEAEPVPERVLASARAVVTNAGKGSSADVAVDSGRRYARLLREGPCRLGRFELLDELGVGSFGYVFRARDVELDRIVAI